MSTRVDESLEDLLYQIRQKAEIINRQIILMPPSGALPGYAGDQIFYSLREYSKRTGYGFAFGDNVGFIVNLPHRQSFCPCAGLFVGAYPGMKFFQGAPVFAVEVRNEEDYGPRAELERAEKRIDYFAAGTLVVWDVDLLSENLIKVYRASDPDNPTIYGRTQFAEAEPAVPGWSMPVDDLFPKW